MPLPWWIPLDGNRIYKCYGPIKKRKSNTQKYTVIEVLIFAESFTCAPRSQSFRALTEALINEGKPEFGRLGCTL